MSHKLPAADSKLRELFTVEQLVEYGTRKTLPPTLAETRAAARKTFEIGGGAIHSITSFVLRADDRLQLVTIGPKGGYRVRWNFGKL